MEIPAQRTCNSVAIALVLLALVACTRGNPKYCAGKSDCAAGVCNLATHECVGGATDAGSGGGDGRQDRTAMDEASGTTGGVDGTAASGGATDGGATGGGPANAGGVDGGATGGGAQDADSTGSDAGPDTRPPCSSNASCATTPATPACDTVSGKCVGCVASADCALPTPVCETGSNKCVECLSKTDCHDASKAFCTNADTCVSCTAAGPGICAGLDSSKPVCGSTGACVECGTDTDCHTATKPFCSTAGSCVPCAMAPPGTGACAARSAALPACGSTGACVECGSDADCHTATKPFCSTTGSCVPCAIAPAGIGACAAKSAALPVCGSTGACVECGTDADCHTATKPFCSTTGSCVPCAVAPAGPGACGTKNTALPVCAPSGACVQCVSNTECPNTTPVCSATNTCGRCVADPDCAGRSGPVVCMSHQDGRCATDAEALYVQSGGACSDSAGTTGGTVATPFCSMQPAVASVGGTRNLVVVRGPVVSSASGFQAGAKQVSIVGQSLALIGGVYPAIHLATGDLYARDLKLTTGSSIGCQADAGSTLRLDHVVVNGNSGGGILVDGAAFVIKNTTVTNNGPGTTGAIVWGGVLVNNPAAAGPAQIQNTTVQGNNAVGISCSSAIQGSGVLATANTSVDIGPACGFTSCVTAGAACGASP